MGYWPIPEAFWPDPCKENLVRGGFTGVVDVVAVVTGVVGVDGAVAVVTVVVDVVVAGFLAVVTIFGVVVTFT